MIGALSTIEKQFGFLWGHGTEEQLTPEQQHLRDLYDEVRSEILDRGNAQSRNLEAEFASYDISWNRYKMELPVKKLDETYNEGDEDIYFAIAESHRNLGAFQKSLNYLTKASKINKNILFGF